MATPVTVLTGYLGAGKTSLVLSLLPKLPRSYRVVLLKNEFGDVAVDSQLAGAASFAVHEMLNGCLCCVLVGQLGTALVDIRERYAPDRIIVETSGAAFPAPIVWQIRSQAADGLRLDAVVTLVDCANFRGYADRSYTARLQAQYTDLLLLNKHELVSARDLDEVIDRVNDLNTDTPRIKVNVQRGDVGPDLVFGLDSRLFLSDLDHHHLDHDHHQREVDIVSVHLPNVPTSALPFTSPAHLVDRLTAADVFPAETVFRVKGTVRWDGLLFVVNVAFGRPDPPVSIDTTNTTTANNNNNNNNNNNPGADIHLTFMGMGLRDVLGAVRALFPTAPPDAITLHERDHDHDHDDHNHDGVS